MPIDEAQAGRIAKLARLKLSAEEIRLYQGQLEKILQSMGELSALDTRNVPPTVSVLAAAETMREDEPEPFEDVESLLEGAPQREGRYFKVRKVIE